MCQAWNACHLIVLVNFILHKEIVPLGSSNNQFKGAEGESQEAEGKGKWECRRDDEGRKPGTQLLHTINH